MDATRTSEAPALVRADEAAALLGVSTRVLYEWAARGVLPAGGVIRAGRSVYFSRARLLEWATGRGGAEPLPAVHVQPHAATE